MVYSEEGLYRPTGRAIALFTGLEAIQGHRALRARITVRWGKGYQRTASGPYWAQYPLYTVPCPGPAPYSACHCTPVTTVKARGARGPSRGL